MEYFEVDTSRYSRVIRAVLEAHPKSEVLINGASAPEAIDDWCSNEKLKKYVNFSVTLEGRELWSYHDHPANLLVVLSEQRLLDRLASEGLLRFSPAEFKKPKSLWKGLKQYFA